MNTGQKLKWVIPLLCMALAGPGIALGSIARVPSHGVPYVMQSGIHSGLEGRESVAFRETVKVPGAAWIRLHFSEIGLGERSYLTIVSLEDGAKQRLDARSIERYQNSSAFFNGDAVEMELVVAPEDKDVFVQMKEVTVGDSDGRDLSTLQVCDPDSRVSSNDPLVGRIVYVNGADSTAIGTAFIAINTALITSGTVAATGNMDILEFNVPNSSPTGQIRHPAPSDQYPIVAGSWTYRIVNDYGNNWAVFRCGENSETGLLPYQAQGRGYRVSHDHLPEFMGVVTLTGFSADYTFLSRNLTQMSDNTGGLWYENFNNYDDVSLQFRSDTNPGGGGSPVLFRVNDQYLAIGIFTYGHCQGPDSYFNWGTSFENNTFEETVSDFLGTDVVYLDPGHPATAEDGTVFRPYNTLSESITAVPTSGTIFMTEGTYTGVTVLSKVMRLIAPVGKATITP